MRNNRNFLIGVTLLFVRVIRLNGLSSRTGLFTGGMLGGGGMMKDMMGARLPPGIDPDKLPDATSDGAQLLAWE